MMGMVLLVLVLLQQQKQLLSYCGVSMTLKQPKAKHRVVVIVEEQGGYHGSWVRRIPSVGDWRIFADGLPGFRARGVSMHMLRCRFCVCIFIYLLLLLIPTTHSWFSCSCSGSGSAAVHCGFESFPLSLSLRLTLLPS